MYSVLTWPQMTVCTFWNIWFWILVRLRVQISNLTLPQVILPSSNRHKSFREQRTCKLQKCTHHWVQFSNFACKTDKTKHFFLIENTCRMVSVCGYFFSGKYKHWHVYGEIYLSSVSDKVLQWSDSRAKNYISYEWKKYILFQENIVGIFLLFLDMRLSK